MISKEKGTHYPNMFIFPRLNSYPQLVYFSVSRYKLKIKGDNSSSLLNCSSLLFFHFVFAAQIKQVSDFIFPPEPESSSPWSFSKQRISLNPKIYNINYQLGWNRLRLIITGNDEESTGNQKTRVHLMIIWCFDSIGNWKWMFGVLFFYASKLLWID